LERAAELLREGGLVAFATETVYRLGADATSDAAVARIYEAKGRPQFNPLIVHVPEVAAARKLGVFNADAQMLAEAFWPGALTLVVPRTSECPVSLLVSAGLDSVALRVPAHAAARDLLLLAGVPVAAPSANRSGQISPTLPEHVEQDLGDRVDLVLDGGPCGIGVESTIVGCLDDRATLLRPGGVAVELIEQVLGKTLDRSSTNSEAPASPGQLLSHYAPAAQVRLNVQQVRPGEALLAFGPNEPAHEGPALNLSPTGDLNEAAANLFAHMRELDKTGTACIAVMPIPQSGLGLAINDRLQRAATGRGDVK
jgi:L-threonylcarbamoyladenylate synthase